MRRTRNAGDLNLLICVASDEKCRCMSFKTSDKWWSSAVQQIPDYGTTWDELPCRLERLGEPREEVGTRNYHAEQTGLGN